MSTGWKNCPRGSVCPACGRVQKSNGGLRQSRDGRRLRCFKCGWSGWADGAKPSRREAPAPPPPPPTAYIPRQTVLGWLASRQQTPLYAFLAHLLGPEATERVFLRYGVGGLPDQPAFSTFPTIDPEKRIRSVKAMAYGPDGRRIKDSRATFTPVPYRGEAYRGVLFGLHLLRPDRPLVVVESEKTALMCACLLPESAVFAALGGAQTYGARVGESRPYLQAYRGLHVEYWPDADRAGAESVAGVRAMFRSCGLPVVVRQLSDRWPDCPSGADLADYLLHRLAGGPAVLPPSEALPSGDRIAHLRQQFWGLSAESSPPASGC